LETKKSCRRWWVKKVSFEFDAVNARSFAFAAKGTKGQISWAFKVPGSKVNYKYNSLES